MNRREINLEKKGIDQTLRDLINNLGLNASYDICVSQIMKDHQPKTVQELIALCDNTGNYTLNQRCNILWSEVKRLNYNAIISEDDVKRMIHQVIIYDTWNGFEVERKAKEYFQMKYSDYKVIQSVRWDKEYSVDMALMTSDKKYVILGIQVKPINYKYYDLESERGKYKKKDKENQATFKELSQTEVLDLYYDKHFKFDNLKEVEARIEAEIKKFI